MGAVSNRLKTDFWNGVGNAHFIDLIAYLLSLVRSIVSNLINYLLLILVDNKKQKL